MYNGQQDYRLNQLHREDVIRAARREHLMRQAKANSPKTRSAYLTALLSLIHSIAR